MVTIFFFLMTNSCKFEGWHGNLKTFFSEIIITKPYDKSFKVGVGSVCLLQYVYPTQRLASSVMLNACPKAIFMRRGRRKGWITRPGRSSWTPLFVRFQSTDYSSQQSSKIGWRQPYNYLYYCSSSPKQANIKSLDSTETARHKAIRRFVLVSEPI